GPHRLRARSDGSRPDDPGAGEAPGSWSAAVIERLQLTSAVEGDAQVLVVRGEVDMESSPRLLEAIQTGLQKGSAQVVDLAGVSYMDSSGIAVLVQGLRAAHKRALPFRLRR